MPRTHCIITGFAVTSLLLLTGCSGDDKAGYGTIEGEQPDVAEVEHHHEHGPNGGHLIELGDDEMYHAELAFDPKTRVTTVYILDGEAKSPSPIDAAEIELHLMNDDDEVELMLAAAPLESDGEGKSSCFELTADKLPESIKDEEDFKGQLHVRIGEEDRIGEIEHHHGEEGDAHAGHSDEEHVDEAK